MSQKLSQELIETVPGGVPEVSKVDLKKSENWRAVTSDFLHIYAKATGACIVLGRSILPVVVTSRRSFGLGSENRSISDCHPWEGVCIDIGSGAGTALFRLMV